MQIIEVPVFKLDELSEEAKRRAYCAWQETYPYAWADENRKTLEVFESIFPIRVIDYSYDSCDGQIKFDFLEEDYIAEMRGIRLMKYIYNNYFDLITKGKYYGKLHSHKKRYSKVIVDKSCSLTGYFMDDVILKPIFDFLKRPSEFITFYDLMEQCLISWIKACVDDVYWYYSFESFKEYVDVNGIEFFEDGSVL